VLRKLNLPQLKNAQPLALKSEYATQGLLDHLFGRRNVSGCGVATVVGAGCYGSDRVPLLVGCLPQRLVLILQFPASEFRRKFECSHVFTSVEYNSRVICPFCQKKFARNEIEMSGSFACPQCHKLLCIRRNFTIRILRLALITGVLIYFLAAISDWL
jgi:hypothetical protein